MLPFWKLGKTNMYNPFEFPFSGKMKVSKTPWEPQGYDANGKVELINIPTGNSGVIRRIQIISESDDQVTNFKKCILNICYDGEVTPSVSVPLASLVAWEHGTPITGPYETPFWTITNPINVGAFNDVANDAESHIGHAHFPSGTFNGDGVNQGLVLTYPIPYTDGIHMYLTRTDESYQPSLWNNIWYQDNLPAVWNRNYRFFAYRSDEAVPRNTTGAGTVNITGTSVVGTGTNFTQADVNKYLFYGIQEFRILSVEDSTHLTIPAKESKTESTGSVSYEIAPGHIWLSRPAGKQGYLASVVLGFDSNNTGINFLEGNPRIRLDKETDEDSIVMTGDEDFFMCAFYFDTLQQNHMGGVTAFSSTEGTVSGYSIFADMPIKYTNGIDCIFPSNHDATLQCNFTSVYYEEQ